MSLMQRLMAAKMKRAVPTPAPTPLSPQMQRIAPAAPAPVAAPLVARGSCKAINPDTGRQCALLASHAGAHRHGSTSFTRAAAPGQTRFTRRDSLDSAAVATNGGSNHE